jgi:hypothetical protein
VKNAVERHTHHQCKIINKYNTYGNHSLNHNTSACEDLFGFIKDIIYKNNNNQWDQYYKMMYYLDVILDNIQLKQLYIGVLLYSSPL